MRQKATNGNVISSFLNYQMLLIKISKAANGMPIWCIFFHEMAKMTALADIFGCESGKLFTGFIGKLMKTQQIFV